MDAYDRNRRTLRTGESFRINKISESIINMRKTKTNHPEMRDSQAECLFGHKKPERRAFVVHSDTKRPKVENMERRPVIIKHRTQRRRTCRIAKRPARDVWKHEYCEASGRQIIRKCEILKQKTTEARIRI